MNVPDIDWQFLRERLGGPLVLLLITSLLWGGSTLYRSTHTAGLTADRETLDALSQERRDDTERRIALRAFSKQYNELQNNGIIGSDQRLVWVQAARQASQDLELPYLRYSTGPQRAFQAPWLDPAATEPVQLSIMEIQVGLVHELDLMRLLDRLRASPGLMQVQGCELQRLAANAIPEPGKANVTGTCQLGWYAIQPATRLATVAHMDAGT